MGSTWRWRKGTNEVSNPTSVWRNNSYNDSAWSLGPAPFRYGYSGGTLLGDMRGGYTCVFLRRTFVITNVAEIDTLQLLANYDDGFAAWINGTLIAQNGVSANPIYTNVSSVNHNATGAETFTSSAVPQNYLVSGTNVLAVQGFNVSLANSSDFYFDASLQITKKVVAGPPPSITAVSPTTNTTVGILTQITVSFSQNVNGVDAADLLLNGQPASAVSASGGTNVYTFTFTQPPAGFVGVSWDEAPDISDNFGQPFDPTGPGTAWSYTLNDNVPPQVGELTPLPGALVSQLYQVEVTFTEPVIGVNAADLLINSQSATIVSGSGSGPYVFQFAQPATGTVQFGWGGGHGITDLASNAFGGGNWTLNLNPDVSPGDVIINEFVAGNLSGLTDEDGTVQDWIELYNRGTNAVNLLGWALTDDPAVPGRWTFPSKVLNPGEYLVVFASEKDRRSPIGANRYHTNFKLNSFGEYLALFNAESPRVPMTEFAPEFPEQRNNYSYGLDGSDVWHYFQNPTPGTANGSSSIVGVLPPPHFSVEHGLFDKPFNLLLSDTASGASVRYTTDGSEPTETNGFDYTVPLLISGTTILRAAAFQAGQLPSVTATRTYLFPDQVSQQPNNPSGYPVGSTVFTGYPSDYEMDPEITADPIYGPQMAGSLKSLPTLSVTIKVDDMFGPVNGIYTHPEPPAAQRGLWERPCSVEFIPTNGAAGFQVNCGIRIQGNASRTPQKTPKHPFRLLFKGDYGPGRLEYQMYPDSPVSSFNTLVLRADFNNSWLHWNPTQRQHGSRIRDGWVKDAWHDMGQAGSHTRFVHLYINGLYWGVYDIGERIDSALAANYYGGQPEEYDAIASKPTAAIDGTITAYNAMISAVRTKDMTVVGNYLQAQQYLDVPNYIDYMLLNFYGGNEDWGFDGNWNAVCRRAAGGTFKYLVWDGELLISTVGYNRVSNSDVPSGLHTNFIKSAEYRLAFADHVYRHMFNDGALSTNAVTQRWLNRAAQVDLAMVAESARWGDYRRDVHQYSSPPYDFYTHDDFWQVEINRLVTSYFPQRHDIVLQQLRNAGLYPSVDAPSFNQHGGRVAAGFNLTMSAPSGTIYYTTNGADPRVFGTSAISPQATIYTGAIPLLGSETVKARAWSGGVWSALHEANFTVGSLGLPLRITEIMYNPPGGDAYEYLEVMNTGQTPLDVGNFTFQGINYLFPAGTVVQPGAVLLLGSSANPTSFQARYPTAVVFGTFGGSLDNGGERLAILSPLGQTVTAVHYDDEGGWSKAADGGGSSLEIIDPSGDPNAPANWRASVVADGTPGLPPAAPEVSDIVLNELQAENSTTITNAGTLPDWMEIYNRGSNVVSLSDWSLTDDSNARKFVFPPGTALESGHYLVVWCDSETNTPGLHTGFALSKNGETVSLFNQNTSRVDAITFGLQLPDYSVGRIGKGWPLTQPTPGWANTAAPVATLSNVALNEWLANPGPGGKDWLELFNRSATAPLALQGLYLGTSNALFQLQALSFLPPLGHAQFFADEQAGPDQLEFKLPASGGVIVLSDSTGLELERVTYGAQATDNSRGRLPDGAANFVTFTASVSPGAANYLSTYTGPRLNEILARNQHTTVSPFGDYADWIELYNSSGTAWNLAGMALGPTPDSKDRWVFPSGASLNSGAYLLIWCDPSRPGTSTNGATFNAGFSLPGGGGSVFLFDDLGQVVDSLQFGVQLADQSIGRSGGNWVLLDSPTPGTANSVPALLASVTSLRINEWLAASPTGEDWFEIFNPEPFPVDLGGMFLTDDPSTLGIIKNPIASLSFIGAKDWVKFTADGNASAGPDHVNFNLDGLGETLRLYQSDLTLIDSVDFGGQTDEVSQGRLPDGSVNIASFPLSPSPGAANYLPVSNVVINEVLTHTDAPLEDAVELYNPTGGDVNLGGWYMSDTQSDLKRYRIPDGTVLSAGGFRVFYQYQFGPGDGEADVPPLFTFNSARGDAIHLSEADAGGNLTGYRSSLSFGASANGVSFGRHQTSIGVDFVALSEHTFGMDSPANLSQFRSGTGRTNAYPLVGPVVINQIMYHPPDFGTNHPDQEEFIELLNRTGSPVPLFDPAHPTNRWHLASAVSFEFPSNTTIPPNGRLVVVPFNPATDMAALGDFQARYGSGATLTGPYIGKLKNAGDTIELWRPDAPQMPPHPDTGFVPQILVERLVYSDSSPWPTNADGFGDSLQRAVAAEYGNDPINWTAAFPQLGGANSTPRATASLPGGGVIRLNFFVQPGYTYQVQYKTNLTDPNWLPLGVPIPALDQSLIKDDNLTGQTSRFYRLAPLP